MDAPILILINTNGSVKLVAEELYDLKFKCPVFKDMKFILNRVLAKANPQAPSIDILEHVSVLFQGKHCHMFVDENGLAMGRQVNPKATWVYYNATHSKNRVTRDLMYTDLSLDPAPLLRSMDSLIVGPALLWTGGME